MKKEKSYQGKMFPKNLKLDEFGNLSPRIQTVEIDGRHARASSMPFIEGIRTINEDETENMHIEIHKGLVSLRTDKKMKPASGKKFESPIAASDSKRANRNTKPILADKWQIPTPVSALIRGS